MFFGCCVILFGNEKLQQKLNLYEKRNGQYEMKLLR